MAISPLFGNRHKVPLGQLQAGMMLLDPIYGVGGKVLVNSGEVLSQKHVDQINRWIARPGNGALLLYNRPDIWVRACRASGAERPKCDADPYAAESIQRYYKRGMKVSTGPEATRPGAVRVMTIRGDGTAVYHGGA